jgi:hypothetical protein
MEADTMDWCFSFQKKILDKNRKNIKVLGGIHQFATKDPALTVYGYNSNKWDNQ